MQDSRSEFRLVIFGYYLILFGHFGLISRGLDGFAMVLCDAQPQLSASFGIFRLKCCPRRHQRHRCNASGPCSFNGEPMLAPQTGHDLTPINREDAARLRDLHVNCTEANLREVKKYAVHYPHLFQVADIVGNTALHYASMSRRSDFVEEVLNIYRDSHTFLHFKLEFKRHEEVEGLLFAEARGPRAAAEFVVSRFSDKKHGRAGIRFGDGLEAVCTKLPSDMLPGRHAQAYARARPDPKVKDVVRALENGEQLKSFPLEFRFCRPALIGIFAQDTWGNIEAITRDAGKQHPDDLKENLKILRLLRKEREMLAQQVGPPHYRQRGAKGMAKGMAKGIEREAPPALPALPALSVSSPRVSKRIQVAESTPFMVTNRGFSKSNSVPIMSWSNKAIDRANWSLPR